MESLDDSLNVDGNPAGLYSMALSPDGANIYVAAQGDHALLVFEKGVHISLQGTVVDSQTGDGISCASVALTQTDGPITRVAVTNTNGEYMLDELQPGMYAVHVDAEGYTPTDEAPIDVSASEQLTMDYSLVPLTATPVIDGTVTDAGTGLPLVGVRVDASSGSQLLDTTYTCASGGYSFASLARKATGSLTLTFSSSHYATVEQSVTPVAGATIQVDKALSIANPGTSTLLVTVQNANGGSSSPMAGAEVIVRGPVNVSASTDADGQVTLTTLPAGRYTIQASTDGFVSQTGAQVVPQDDSVEKLFQLAQKLGSTDVNADGSVNAVDVQLVINGALGLTPASGVNTDITGDGQSNAVDVQLVINAALGIK